MSDDQTAIRNYSNRYSQQDCCIVGGGPAGMVLALLLVRQGVRVTVLEAHEDFDRKCRGDTIHPSVLEILDQIGLSDALLQLQHSKIYGPTLRAANASFNPFDFRRLKTKFPFIMLVPQTKFLDFLSHEAGRYEEFDLRFSSKVESLIDENGSIRGVRYMSRDGVHEVKAPVVSGADGRFSTVRERAGLVPNKTSPPMDILWFELPDQRWPRCRRDLLHHQRRLRALRHDVCSWTPDDGRGSPPGLHDAGRPLYARNRDRRSVRHLRCAVPKSAGERVSPVQDCSSDGDTATAGCSVNRRSYAYHGHSGIEIAAVSGRSPHCSREQARELLEGLRAAYQSLLPAERTMIRSMIAQSAQTQFAQEMNDDNEDVALPKACGASDLSYSWGREVT